MKLKQLRKSKYISLTGVAKELKLNRERLYRIEEGTSYLPAIFIPVLANLYGVSNDEIIQAHMEDINETRKI